MKKILFALALMIYGVALTNRAHAVHYSKLGIVTAAKAAGKWEAVKSWIAENDYTDEWHAAAYFSDDYPLFATITNQVVASGLATCAEVDAFLAAAQDTAPDALLGAAYANDMGSAAGRQRWHGVPTYIYETNAVERKVWRVETYPDGYRYVVPGSRRQYLTPEEEEERRRRREERRRDGLAAQIAALKARIAELEAATVPASESEADRVAAARAVIELASARRRLERLEATQTNAVDVVVGPGVEVR